MPKKMDKPLEVATIKLFEGDKETLKRFYPAPIGYNAAIRQIVHHHCNKLREAESRKGGNVNVGTDVELDFIPQPEPGESDSSAA